MKTKRTVNDEYMTPNEVYLGDALELIKDLKDNEVDVAFTSPPYNRKVNDTYEEYDDTRDDYFKFLCDITEELLRVTKREVIINIQRNRFNKKEVYRWLGVFGDYIVGDITWVKRNPQPNNNYREEDESYSITNCYENFYVLRKDTEDFRANRVMTNVVISNVNSKHIYGHGAIMHEDIATWILAAFTKEGDYVIDPFMGTGTTGVVCRSLKRHFIGFEIAEKYWLIAKARTSGGGE